MSSTYSDVDRSGDPSEAVRWQEYMATWPFVQAYKQRTFELLALTRNAKVLDVGCGPGLDLAELAARSAVTVGVDRSLEMLRQAADREQRAVRADAAHLPFANASFDGARADRVLQHVADPAAVCSELARVCRPGGHVVVVDPDQSTLRLHVTSTDLDRRVADFRRRGIRNPTSSLDAVQAFAATGLVDVATERMTLELADPADAFGLPGLARLLHAEGGCSAADVAAWTEAMARTAADGTFAYSVDFVITSAAVPSD